MQFRDVEALLKMRPLKIRELKEVFRINVVAETGSVQTGLKPVSTTTFEELVDLVALTVTAEPDNLLQTMFMFGEYVGLGRIIDEFIALNYSDTKKAGGDKCTLAAAIDSLINQGHSCEEIMEYTLPQFVAFQDAAIERLEAMTGKKKKKATDPLEFFTKMGIPIDYRKS